MRLREDPGRRPSTAARVRERLAWALSVVLVLLAAVPIVTGLMLTPGGVSVSSASGFTPAKGPAGVAQLSPVSSLPGGSGALVANVLHATVMRTRPAGAPLGQLGVRTNFGSPSTLWVVRQSPGWLGVVSPLAGNGRIGWIPESAASLTRVAMELRVSLAAHKLTVLQGGKVLQVYTVADGRPTAPTPTGHFDVTDRLLTGDPTGPYGCCVIALSALAPHAIADWTGGSRVAIHSTPETSSIGYSVSHGCIRITLAQGRWLLAHVPLGTPTVISA